MILTVNDLVGDRLVECAYSRSLVEDVRIYQIHRVLCLNLLFNVVRSSLTGRHGHESDG